MNRIRAGGRNDCHITYRSSPSGCSSDDQILCRAATSISASLQAAAQVPPRVPTKGVSVLSGGLASPVGPGLLKSVPRYFSFYGALSVGREDGVDVDGSLAPEGGEVVRGVPPRVEEEVCVRPRTTSEPGLWTSTSVFVDSP